MSPPPPSQAGRFRPRKPGKKISIGASGGASVPEPVASAPSARAGRGPKRTGRGGRSTVPPPQGQVFFTANQPAATKRSSAATTTATTRKPQSDTKTDTKSETTAKRKKKPNAVFGLEVDEEVVGQVEGGGIGETGASSATSSKKKADSNKKLKEPSSLEMALKEQAKQLSSAGLKVYEYDSDSSASQREEVVEIADHDDDVPMNHHLEPVVLPPSSTSTPEPSSSLLPNANSNEWLLLQLPTRLPPTIHDDAMKMEAASVSDEVVETTHELADVATKPVQPNSFDNVLSNLPDSGKLGKLRVYKSGKMKLVLESTNGSPVVELDVSEGLSCSFRQDAVAIDKERKEFTPLGRVKRTAVVTPHALSP